MKQKTKPQLARELLEARASDIVTLGNSSREILKAGDNLTASAAIVTIEALGGRLITRFAIHDGLSIETINALKLDIQRTIELRLMYAGLKS